jgi:tetratricopeptide (TPR) repeat protein
MSFTSKINVSVKVCILSSLLTINVSAFAMDPVLSQANEAVKAGQPQSAKLIYQAYLLKDPTSIEAQLALAKIEQDTFHFVEARLILEKALRQSPNDPRISAHLGQLYLAWTEASQTLGALPTPTGPGTHGQVMKVDYRAKAGDYLTMAHQLLIPGSPYAAEVNTYYAQWLAKSASNADTPMAQAQLKEAKQLLEEAQKTSAPSGQTYQALGQYYLSLKNYPQAKNALLLAKELSPQDSQNDYLLAQVLEKAAHPEDAVRYAERSEIYDNGVNPERDFFLVRQYQKLGDTAKGSQKIQTLKAMSPKPSAKLLMAEANATTKPTKVNPTETGKAGSPSLDLTPMAQAMQQDPSLLQQKIDTANFHLVMEQTQLSRENYPTRN